MDYWLLSFTLGVFLVSWLGGRVEYRRLMQCWPQSGMAGLHQHGSVRFLLLAMLVVLSAMLYVLCHRSVLWSFPDWLDSSLLFWTNGSGSILFGLLLGLSGEALKRERLRNLRALVLAAALCQAALCANSMVTQRFMVGQASDAKFRGEMLFQTSGSTCAAASGANVAGLFGFSYSEKDMCRLMGTRISGTSPAAILRGMSAAGLQGVKFELNPIRLEAIPLPAILLVDHPQAGTESHAVVAVRFDEQKRQLEIWDPLIGRLMAAQTDLARTWHGRGLAFKRVIR